MKHKNSTVEIKAKLKRKDYEKELRRLQVELCILQEWVKHNGLRVIIVFEGRDGAVHEVVTSFADVREPPAAKRVTSWPRSVSPSAR